MTLRIALVTGMFPTPASPYGGIFISHRVVALRSAGVDVTPFAVQVENSPTLLRIRRVLGRPALETWGERSVPAVPGDIEYRIISVKEGVISKAINRVTAYRYQVGRIERAVARAVGALPVDALHAHWAFTTGAAVQRSARRLGLPMVLTCHGSDINVLGSSPRYRAQVVAALEGADEVEFVSQALKRRAKELGYSGANAHVVPNGIWPSQQRRVAGASNWNEERPQRVLYVGSLREIKGADRLPEIFDALARRASSPLEFRVVGGGVLLDSLRAWAHGSGAVVLGAVPPDVVEREMREADVMVMPSRNEGWPTVVLEAHSAGLPVVAADAGGTAEAVGDSRMILPVDAGAEDFAGRILDVLEGRIPIDVEQLATRAVEFDWSTLAESTVAAFGRITRDS